jgi:hypothetical protein
MTERSIQTKLKNWKKGNGNIFVPNVFLFGTEEHQWESDLLMIDRDDYVTEFEIKTSKQDFEYDSQKEEKHSILRTLWNDFIPNFFVYASPEGIIREEEVPEYAGLVYIVQSNQGKVPRWVKHPPMLSKNKMEDHHWKTICQKLSRKLL